MVSITAFGHSVSSSELSNLRVILGTPKTALGIRSEDDLVDPQTLKLMLKVRVFLETPEGSKISTFMYTAATAAKSLQSCLTLCYPRDSSPPGSPVLEILQARTLEWVAIFLLQTWCIVNTKKHSKLGSSSLPSLKLFVLQLSPLMMMATLYHSNYIGQKPWCHPNPFFLAHLTFNLLDILSSWPYNIYKKLLTLTISNRLNWAIVYQMDYYKINGSSLIYLYI